MNLDDIIRMAQQAGWEMPLTWDESDGFLQRLERFAALVRAAEREACAKVCEPQDQHDDPLTAWKIAAAIRARGEK